MSIDLQNMKFNPNISEIFTGYVNSSMLAGAYSAYNPFVMHFAGLMGALHASFIPKK